MYYAYIYIYARVQYYILYIILYIVRSWKGKLRSIEEGVNLIRERALLW